VRVLLAAFFDACFLFAADDVDCAPHARPLQKNELVLAFVCIVLVLVTASSCPVYLCTHVEGASEGQICRQFNAMGAWLVTIYADKW